MKTWKTWTRKEIDSLEAMRLDGRTRREIASALGRTEASVSNRIAQERFGRRPMTRYRESIELLSRPMPLKHVAQIMGICINAVKHRKTALLRMGFQLPKLPHSGKPAPDLGASA